MASPEEVVGQPERDVPDASVPDTGVASEHEGSNNPTQSHQPLPTEDPPTTAEAVLRILTEVQSISSKIGKGSDGSPSGEGRKSDDEPAAAASEVKKECV